MIKKLGDFDSSLGNVGPRCASKAEETVLSQEQARLPPDGHARKGMALCVSAGIFHPAEAANAAGWCFHTRSSLNPTISVSTTEAELTACTFIARALLEMLNFVRGYVPWLQFKTPVAFGDNSGANLIAAGRASIRAVHHLALQSLFCRHVTREGQLIIKEKRSLTMSADLLTKIMMGQAHTRLLQLFNIFNK